MGLEPPLTSEQIRINPRLKKKSLKKYVGQLLKILIKFEI